MQPIHLSLTKFRERNQLKREQARVDMLERERRTKVLQLLYEHWPKNSNHKARTDLISKLADEIVKIIRE